MEKRIDKNSRTFTHSYREKQITTKLQQIYITNKDHTLLNNY